MFILDGFPEGFDWRAYDKQKLQRHRSIEARRRALQTYMPAMQRILSGAATSMPTDQSLIAECVRLVLDEVAEDMRAVAELHHRHAAAKPPEPPPADPSPPSDSSPGA